MLKKSLFLGAVISILVLFFILDTIFYHGQIVINSFSIQLFRLPKIIVLIIGTAGATFATYTIHLITKNRVSDIGTIGVSSMNLFIFVVVYSFSSVQTFIWMRKYVMWAIYLAGSIGILVIIFVLTVKFRKSMNKIVLIGIVFSLFISALSFLFISQMSPGKQEYVTQISVGTILDGAGVLTRMSTIISEILLAIALLLYSVFYLKIKIAYTDELRARSLGLNVPLIRAVMMLIAALSATSAFLLLGSVAFIGFVASNITYIFFNRLTYYRVFITFAIAISLMLVVYFVNFSWLYWNITIGIVSNIVALPYLVIVLLRKKQSI